MTEQQMPARIWADSHRVNGRTWGFHEFDENENKVEFVRADLAERMAEALEQTAAVCAGDTMSKSGLIRALESARSALSAFRSATQDTEARHD